MAEGKSPPKTFTAFFSYAHIDAKADPQLLKWFTEELAVQVRAAITKAFFKVWHDKEGVRTGEDWNDRLMQEVCAADVLIVLMTPRWLSSEFCRKEFMTFEKIETARGVGRYIVPILWREIDTEKHAFDHEETALLERLKTRQFKPVTAKDFGAAAKAKRVKLIKEIAEDIAGMIMRLQKLAARPAMAPSPRPRGRSADLDAHNFADYQFARNAEVTMKPSGGERHVYAQVDFHDRMFIESDSGRVEFGVRRAVLEIANKGPGKLARAEYLRGARSSSAYYLTPKEGRDLIAVSIDAQDRPSLGELALPPGPGDNYWSLVAVATPDVRAEKIEARMTISLTSEGIYLADVQAGKVSPKARSQIEAILAVAAERHASNKTARRLGQSIEVTEKS